MKKILSILFAAATLLTIANSCSDNEYRTYDYFTNTIMNVRDAGRASLIKESITSDPYFTTKHSYKGTMTQTVTLAANEFDAHINVIDLSFIKSQLEFGESVSISLWAMDPAQRWLTYVITPEYMLLDEKNF